MHEKQPVVFYNLCDASVTERKDDISKSYSNESEARFVLHLYSTLVTVYPKCTDLSVVILTPYNEQKALVRRCTCISFVVPKVHCRAVQYDCAEAAGVDCRRLSGKGGRFGLLLNCANRNRLRRWLCFGHSSHERELHASSIRLVRGRK